MAVLSWKQSTPTTSAGHRENTLHSAYQGHHTMNMLTYNGWSPSNYSGDYGYRWGQEVVHHWWWVPPPEVGMAH